MQLSIRAFAVLTAFTFLSACGDDNKTSDLTTYKLGTAEYVTVDAGTLTHESEALAGTGSVAFVAPLAAVQEGASFDLTFSLADAGSLSLVAFSDAKLVGGNTVKFTRTGETLEVKLVSGADEVDVSSAFTSVNASGEIHLIWDVHNDESPAHLLAWLGSTESPAEDNATFNSETEGFESPGVGTGTVWGLVLSNATVTAVAQAEPLFEEE